MGLIDKILRRTVEPAVAEATAGYLQTVTAYSPVFTSFAGGVYEAELCRAAIHTFATHCSKLKPEISGLKKASNTNCCTDRTFIWTQQSFCIKPQRF